MVESKRWCQGYVAMTLYMKKQDINEKPSNQVKNLEGKPTLCIVKAT